MSQQREPLVKRLESLIARSIREQTEASARVVDLVQKATAGELPADRLGRELLAFAQGETEKYFGRLADLNLQFLHSVLDLNREQSDKFFRWIEQVGASGEDGAVGVPPSADLLLELEGAPGEEVGGSFTVHNDQPNPVDISMVATAFRCDQTGESFDAALVFPPLPAVPPGERVAVSFQLQLSPRQFVVARTYQCRIFVRGYDEAAVALRVRVVAPRQTTAAVPDPDEPRPGAAVALDAESAVAAAAAPPEAATTSGAQPQAPAPGRKLQAARPRRPRRRSATAGAPPPKRPDPPKRRRQPRPA